MLPILKGALIVKNRTSNGLTEREESKEDQVSTQAQDIEEPMRDFIQAVHANDALSAAEAMTSAHEIMHGRMTPEDYAVDHNPVKELKNQEE